ncbi:MAG: DUF5011 domain-containing protein [Eubacterium sp.]|jgi:hypothetical protein|nr:DUF5011 domain-containing protein [Eubacterium sp.]
MKYVKYGIMTLFLISIIIYIAIWYKDKSNVDSTVPVIQMSQNQIEVSVKDKKALLKGVIAKDAKDGDITNKIVVESISKFVDKKEHICNVTYAVSNSGGHVAKASRKVKFIDYTSPRFVLKKPLCLETGSDTGVEDIIGAKDIIDGDISNKVKILSSDISTNISGDNTVTAQVTNSLGDTVKLKATVIIKQQNNISPTIQLKKNIEYIKKDEEFDAKSFIKSVEDIDGKSMEIGSVKIKSSSVKTNKVGCYTVEYSVVDHNGNEGTAYLTVMVEE